MPERICDACGKKKNLDRGATCETGHFLCSGCKLSHRGVLFDNHRSKCPICSKPLR